MFGKSILIKHSAILTGMIPNTFQNNIKEETGKNKVSRTTEQKSFPTARYTRLPKQNKINTVEIITVKDSCALAHQGALCHRSSKISKCQNTLPTIGIAK